MDGSCGGSLALGGGEEVGSLFLLLFIWSTELVMFSWRKKKWVTIKAAPDR